MTSDLLEATKAVIQRSAAPLKISQIWTAVRKQVKVPAKDKDRFVAEVSSCLKGREGIHLWPEFNGAPVFFNRPLSACVEEALLRAMDEEPLADTKAGQMVKKALRFVSKEQALKEIAVVLSKLMVSGAVVRVSMSRKSAVYLSRSWMAKRAGDGDGLLKRAIPAAIARLQSGPGNYVRVDHLRMATELRCFLDKAVIELADRRQVVLAHFDGPYPVPDERKWNYVEDDKGDLFIGVALPRGSEA